MGLQCVSGKAPTKKDVRIGKNYLLSDELYILHILCEQFLLYAESKALRGQRLTMRKLQAKLDALLATNEYPVFGGYKDYLKDRAVEHAEVELELFRERVNRGEALPTAVTQSPKPLPNRMHSPSPSA